MSRGFKIFLIACALLVGFLYIAPQTFIGLNLNREGKSFVILQLDHHADEAEGYIQRAREIYDGHLFPEPTTYPWIPKLLFSAFLFVTRGNVDLAYLIANFVFSGLIFLIFYYLGWIFWRNRIWALFLAFTGILTPIATHFAQAFTSFSTFLDVIIKNFYPLINSPLPSLFFSRIDNPLLTYPFYLGAIITLYLFWQKPKLSTAVLAALFSGLLFYVYFPYQVYWTIVIGLLFLYSALLKIKKKDEGRFKYSLILIGLLAVFATPYLINSFSVFHAPGGGDYIKRVGVEVGRNFRFSRILDYLSYTLLTGLVYWVFYWRTRKETNQPNRVGELFLIAILAMFLTWNIQLITGFVPHPYNFLRAFSPIILLITLYAVYELSKKFPQRWLVGVLIALMSLLVIKKVVNAAIFIKPPQQFLQMYSFDSNIVDSWRWINKNLPHESIIISPSFHTTHYLALYTSAEPFLQHGQMRVVSNWDLEQRLLITEKIFGVKPENFINPDVLSNIYYNYFRPNFFDVSYLNNFDPKLRKADPPPEKILELNSRFKSLKLNGWPKEAQYIYFGPEEKKLSAIDLNRDSSLQLVYKNSEVGIYKIKP